MSELPRYALLQDLHYGGRSTCGWFADKQMNVIGHDNVTGQRETVAVAHLAQNLDKYIFGADGGKHEQTPVLSHSGLWLESLFEMVCVNTRFGALRPSAFFGRQNTGITYLSAFGREKRHLINKKNSLLSKLAEKLARQSRKHSIICPLASYAVGRLAIRKCCC